MPTGSPSLAEWKALYDAALEFKSIGCWDWMHDSMLFGVQDPETGDVGYCCVLGANGEVFALNVYLGAEGLDGYIRMATARTPAKDPGILCSQLCLMASFEDRPALNKRDQDVIRSLGLKFRGRNAWPQFREYRPGCLPWYLTKPQARFLTVALEQAKDVALRIRDDMELPLRGPEGTMLVRALRVTKSGAQWKDEYVEPEPPPPVIVDMAIDGPRLDKLQRDRLQKAGTWEVEYTYHLEPVQDHPSQRPYFPRALTCAESSSGIILDMHLFGFGSSIADARNRLMHTMEKYKSIPEVFLVKRPEAHNMLAPVATKLSIEVKKAKRLKGVEEMFKEFERFLRR